MNPHQIISYSASLSAYLILLIIFAVLRSPFFLPLAVFLLLVTSIIFFVKWTFPMPRPDAATHTSRWFWDVIDEGSFPSAHAARACGLMVLSFPFVWWAPLPLACYAAIIGFVRVKLRRHFARDVLWGWVFGAVIAVLTLFLLRINYL